MRWRDFLSITADILQIIGWLGFTFASLWAVGMTWLGWENGTPWFWIVGFVPISTLALLASWAWIRSFGNPPSRFDLAKWTYHEAYSVWVAANLWINRYPWPTITPRSPAYAPMQKIKTAIETRQINVLSGEGMRARVTREELIKLAGIHNERPKFLYPD